MSNVASFVHTVISRISAVFHQVLAFLANVFHVLRGDVVTYVITPAEALIAKVEAPKAVAPVTPPPAP